MLISDNSICKICQGIFCCADCRHKHEIKNHAMVVQKSNFISKESEINKCIENKPIRAFKETFVFCPICEKRPLIVQPELHNEILQHIEFYHLPLRCLKCFKIYNNINDLKEFSKCALPTIVCQDHETVSSNRSCRTDEASKVTVTKAVMPDSISQIRQDFNESHMTPISAINMRWKAKSKLAQEEFISDSVSSIKNISSISNSSKSTETSSEVKGKVTRCSSTPVHTETVANKPKEQTFNVTGSGHLSSIQNSGSESDNSPALLQPNSQALESIHRNMKTVKTLPRITAVTPLRQVMSKSIQKAFAEHGLPASTALRGSTVYQQKKVFDSTSSRDVDKEHSPQPPLDLRLSPAVRRSQSESNQFSKNQYANNQQKKRNELQNMRREILLSSKKLTTESIVITRTEHLSSFSSSSSNFSTNSLNPYSISTNSFYQSAECNNTKGSVFKSCSSVEIITAKTEAIQQVQSLKGENVSHTLMSPLTPITRIPGAVIHKKLIQFDTPKIESLDSSEYQNSPNEAFFTPNSTPIHKNCESDTIKSNQRKFFVKQNLSGRFSPQGRPPIKEWDTAFSCAGTVTNNVNNLRSIDNEDDAEFLSLEPENSSQKLNIFNGENKNQQVKGLWSLMTTVMRLPSRKMLNSKVPCKSEPFSGFASNSNSIIKRCATIAGSLVRSKSIVGETELMSLKRKRTYTPDNQSTSEQSILNNSQPVSPTPELSVSSKRFRIQGRRPIERMRLNSEVFEKCF